MAKPFSAEAQRIRQALANQVSAHQCELDAGLADVLETTADQLVPNEPHPEESVFWDSEASQEWQQNRRFRKSLLNLADELRGLNV